MSLRFSLATKKQNRFNQNRCSVNFPNFYQFFPFNILIKEHFEKLPPQYAKDVRFATKNLLLC